MMPPSERSRVALGLTAAAALGRFELQVCRQCGTVQYPPREACHRCLSVLLDWKLQGGEGELISETLLFHSHAEFFREFLPLRLGMVRLDCGPTAIVYLHAKVPPAPARVKVDARLDKASRAVLVAFPAEYGAQMKDYDVDDGTLVGSLTRAVADAATAGGQSARDAEAGPRPTDDSTLRQAP